MRVLYSGHSYELDHLDGREKSRLQFVQRKPFHEPLEGTTNQEVMRALIDRVMVLHEETPWSGNSEILYHLRMALVLHEARALVRHVEKGSLNPERVALDHHGHFELSVRSNG